MRILDWPKKTPNAQVVVIKMIDYRRDTCFTVLQSSGVKISLKSNL